MGSLFSSVASGVDGPVFPPSTCVDVDPSDRLLQCSGRWPPRSEEQRDASVPLCALPALAHYISKNPRYGAEFDLVKPLMASNISFRGCMWYHVSFWARRRGAPPETPVQQFFGELKYTGNSTTPVVETCSIVSKISTCQPLPPTRKKKKPRRSVCAFCPRHYEIFHPKKGKFVFGKEEAHGQECVGRVGNCLELPFTCSAANEAPAAT